MKRWGTRVLSLLMTVVMTVMLFPVPAWASLGDLLTRDAAYNREILEILEDMTQIEAEAREYYDLLQRYNLLDEDGNAVESWSVTMDGREVTLEEIREVLAGDYDPQALVWVDGTPVTLENLDIILQIEDYIAYLRETYFSDVEWTPEQLASLESLREQINTSGIQVLAPADDSGVGPSGVNHKARVLVSSTSDGEFVATLTNPTPGVTVTFDWEALSGSQEASGEGAVTLTEGNSSVTFQVTLPQATTETVRSEADLVYYVKLDNIKNALFDDNGTGREAMTLRAATSPTVTDLAGVVASDGFTYTKYCRTRYYGMTLTGDDLRIALYDLGQYDVEEDKIQTIQLPPAEQNAILWGIINHAEISQNFLNEDESTWNNYVKGPVNGPDIGGGSINVHGGLKMRLITPPRIVWNFTPRQGTPNL